MDKPIKIIITDDKARLRKEIAFDLKQFHIQTIGEAGNGIELLAHLESLRPDVILLDLEMPEMDGNMTMAHLRERHSDLKIIVLSGHGDSTLIEDYKARGAKGYLAKDEALDDMEVFASIIKKIHSGGSHFYYEKAPLRVTDRQKDIIHLSAKGKSREEIGKEIGISPDGVFRQEKKIMAKMGVNHIGEFYRYIARAGLEFLRKPRKQHKDP